MIDSARSSMNYDVAITLLFFLQLLDFCGTIRDNMPSIRTARFGSLPGDCENTVSRELVHDCRTSYFSSDSFWVDVI